MQGKRILLIVGGGIAAYKSCELVRAMRKAGADVTCVLTAGGAQFVTAMTLAALSENPVHERLFDLTREAEMGHIQLSRAADLVVVCPATADLMARMAAGLADDLAATLLLATDKPVLCAPAMNVRMWAHAATRANVATLRARGVAVIEPDVGAMACGEFGPGRLPEVEAILAEVARFFAPRVLAGRHVLVTAGPTWEPIDPVRYIANRSSGKQGYAIAAAAAAAGARVTLVSGPVALVAPAGVAVVRVETAVQMAAAVDAALADAVDVAVMVAAVADWRVDGAGQSKIKKDGSGRAPALALVENPDILAGMCRDARRPRLVVGFAAETDDVLAHAVAKRARKGADWIVANDVSGPPGTGVMGGDSNLVHIVRADGVETLPAGLKDAVAAAIVERIAREIA